MEYGLTIRPIEEYHGEPVYKVVFIAPNEACLAEAKQLYEDQFIFCESRVGITHQPSGQRGAHQPQVQQGHRHQGHLR